MLRLSQDQQNPQSIQFDESNWQLHLSSLKPLGLNVLLNLCNPDVTTTLCRFSDHLRHIALQETHCSVLPGHIPWGLCDFSRLIGMIRLILSPLMCTFFFNKKYISHFVHLPSDLCLGFTPGAKDLFKLQNHVALYHLPSDETVKEPLLCKLQTVAKRRPPLSHMISLFVKDVTSSKWASCMHFPSYIVFLCSYVLYLSNPLLAFLFAVSICFFLISVYIEMCLFFIYCSCNSQTQSRCCPMEQLILSLKPVVISGMELIFSPSLGLTGTPHNISKWQNP